MKKIQLILILGVLFSIGCSQNLDKNSIRTTLQGEVIGFKEDGTFVWRGIPFAQPPVGELRWKAPVRPDSFETRYEAKEFGSACFQAQGIMGGEEGKWMGSEDCLYLNIWSPEWKSEEASQKKVPVMMWIHGGANIIGSSDMYNPSHIVANHEVVVVTVNYRMSNLGWFRHPALRQGSSTLEDASGNYGTLDNIMALRWIKENISAFGGDVDNVTIFGESAGGHNVAALYASPLAKGLFHKAIVQSGVISHSKIEEADSYYPEDGISGITSSKEVINQILINQEKAENKLEAKEIQDNMSLEQIESFLRDTTPEELLTAYSEASPKRGGMTRVFNDGHVMGKKGISEPFVNNQMLRVPIILGTNRYESKLFNLMNPRFVRWGEGEGIFSWIGIDEIPLEIMRPDFYNAVNQYSSDSWKERAADTPARQLVKTGHDNAFVYRFDWDDLPVIQEVDYGILAGAAHALELMFLFPAAFDNFLIKNVVIRDSYDGAKRLSDQMLSYWAQFAYTGDPGKGRLKDLPQWKSWSDKEKYMIFDSEEGQGLLMVNEEVTVDSIYNELITDDRFSKDEKCQSLFGMSYTGDEFPVEFFNAYSDGYCLTLDYSDVLEIMGQEGDNDD
tara:strand:- start:3631 stop:5481 length:1851 start_codon:yes stop_codon:yes gene_type:complete